MSLAWKRLGSRILFEMSRAGPLPGRGRYRYRNRYWDRIWPPNDTDPDSDSVTAEDRARAGRGFERSAAGRRERVYREGWSTISVGRGAWTIDETEKIGAAGFEPTTTRTPSECATSLRHAPIWLNAAKAAARARFSAMGRPRRQPIGENSLTRIATCVAIRCPSLASAGCCDRCDRRRLAREACAGWAWSPWL